jgi:regulator of nucleoside diphosphate kinase
MEKSPAIVISKTVYQNLMLLTEKFNSEISELLELEISRAEVVDDHDLQPGIVTMNSVVTFKDLDSEKVFEVTLVYPPEADVDQNRISILTPVGSALIGLRKGQSIDWPLPNGKTKHIKVVEVA